MHIRVVVFLLAVAACLAWVTPAAAYCVNVCTEQSSGQDFLNVEGWVHELGDQPPFPADEWIISSWAETSYRPCLENPDTAIPNIEVTITNMTGHDHPMLCYVADYAGGTLENPALGTTTFQNYDEGRIGNAGLNDAWLAFRIDACGANKPLVYESVAYDGVFAAVDPANPGFGETWRFVIQDFVGAKDVNGNSGPAAPFNSLGIASVSGGWPPSTGSIITPEPSMLILVLTAGVAASLACLRRRRQ